MQTFYVKMGNLKTSVRFMGETTYFSGKFICVRYNVLNFACKLSQFRKRYKLNFNN